MASLDIRMFFVGDLKIRFRTDFHRASISTWYFYLFIHVTMCRESRESDRTLVEDARTWRAQLPQQCFAPVRCGKYRPSTATLDETKPSSITQNQLSHDMQRNKGGGMRILRAKPTDKGARRAAVGGGVSDPVWSLQWRVRAPVAWHTYPSCRHSVLLPSCCITCLPRARSRV